MVIRVDLCQLFCLGDTKQPQLHPTSRDSRQWGARLGNTLAYDFVFAVLRTGPTRAGVENEFANRMILGLVEYVNASITRAGRSELCSGEWECRRKRSCTRIGPERRIVERSLFPPRGGRNQFFWLWKLGVEVFFDSRGKEALVRALYYLV